MEDNHDLYLVLIYTDVSDYCVQRVRMSGCKTVVQEVAQTGGERERETLVKLACYNRKRSNLLLITA